MINKIPALVKKIISSTKTDPNEVCKVCTWNILETRPYKLREELKIFFYIQDVQYVSKLFLLSEYHKAVCEVFRKKKYDNVLS
jgi:hypothetical protein